MNKAVRELLDRAAVADLFHRYQQGLDRDDGEMIVSTFTDDVEIVSVVGTSVGMEAARRQFCTPGFGPPELDRVLHRTHVVGNLTIALDGDEASGDATCVSFVTGERDASPLTLVRGLRYDLRFRREPVGWRIRRFGLSLQWMYEAVPVRS